jgi:hypothetical protein
MFIFIRNDIYITFIWNISFICRLNYWWSFLWTSGLSSNTQIAFYWWSLLWTWSNLVWAVELELHFGGDQFKSWQGFLQNVMVVPQIRLWPLSSTSIPIHHSLCCHLKLHSLSNWQTHSTNHTRTRTHMHTCAHMHAYIILLRIFIFARFFNISLVILKLRLHFIVKFRLQILKINLHKCRISLKATLHKKSIFFPLSCNWVAICHIVITLYILSYVFGSYILNCY